MGVKIYRKHLKSGLPSNKSRNSEICAGHQAKATQTQTHTQTHTRTESDSLPNTNSETPGYRHTVKQKLPKPKLPYGQVSLRRFGPSLAFAHPNPHPYG